jgi:proteasome lid subunit RPN8/RPN11
MLFIPRALLAQIEAHGAAAYPHEGCGLLLGAMEAGVNRVTGLFPAENSWPNEAEKPERFLIAPREMLRAEMAAMKADVDVIGIFHSHPDHPPIASPRDLAWATWPNYSYLITEVRQGTPGVSRAWQLTDARDGFDEQPVQIETNQENGENHA